MFINSLVILINGWNENVTRVFHFLNFKRLLKQNTKSFLSSTWFSQKTESLEKKHYWKRENGAIVEVKKG